MKGNLKSLKIALVTDWLTNLGGAEKVLKAVSDIFPEAPIYTTVVNQENVGDLAKKDIRTSWLQKIPIFNKKHQLLLPKLPHAIESLDLSEYDLIISFSSCVAKSVITTPEQTHICYIHSPMRYAWEPEFDDRFKRIPRIFKPLTNRLLRKLRDWDSKTSDRPDLYIANSTTTQGRVRKYYGRDTEVLYPPVEVRDFQLFDETLENTPRPLIHQLTGGVTSSTSRKLYKTDYFICVGRMVAYKKFDLLVKTFKKLPEKRLVFVGDGPERKDLQKLAEGGENIEFRGEVPFAELKKTLSHAKALLLPQKEDAGIVQLEAFASGIPVVGYQDGGLCDVLIEGTNGVFFSDQTPESVIQALEKFKKSAWDPVKIRETAQKYDTKKFQQKFMKIMEEFLNRKI